MATTGGPADHDSNICAVCMESGKDQKCLACHHSFCSDCIQDIAKHYLCAPFPCPSCGLQTTLPSGGVVALQTNFHLQTTQSQPAMADLCKTHPDKPLKFYCNECDQALCMNCNLTDHEGHKTKDLSTVVKIKQKELSSHTECMDRAVVKMTAHVDSSYEERQALQKKRPVLLERGRRHALTADFDRGGGRGGDRWNEETMASLQSVTDDIDFNLTSHPQQGRLDELLDTNSASDIIAVSKDMRTGLGRQSDVNTLMSHVLHTVARPIPHFRVTADVLLEKKRDYLGSVEMNRTQEHTTVMVVERFTCSTVPGVSVFSLCHVDKDTPVVYVSYDKAPHQPDLPVKGFTEEGVCVDTGTAGRVGKLTTRRFTKGHGMHIDPRSGRFITDCKSLTATHFCLNNNMAGRGDIKMIKVVSIDPLKAKEKTEFSINVGQHRAIDVDETEQWFAVVEEAQLTDARRKVRLYQRSVQDAVATYQPPTAACQPSDVCFYRLGGRPVLLVSDELNDAVHVVRVECGRMVFVRYLCAGCPLLLGPTALNADMSGRLWLACRGGTVLTLQETE